MANKVPKYYLDKKLDSYPQGSIYALDELLTVVKKDCREHQLEYIERESERYMQEVHAERNCLKNEKERKILKLYLRVFESFQFYVNYLKECKNA